MFVIDEKLIKNICKRVAKYPELPRTAEFTFQTYVLEFHAEVEIDEDQIILEFTSDLKGYEGRAIIRNNSAEFVDCVFDCSTILNLIDKEQTKLINEFKKPLEYKINKLYKLIYRRIISKNLYWKDTSLITSCNSSSNILSIK